MTRTGQAGVLAILVAAIVALTGWSSAASSPFLQDDSPQIIEVGSGPLGERTLGLTGRNVYQLEQVELYGWVSAVAGLNADDLFGGAAPSEQTARFTYAGEISIASSENRADVTITDGTGTLRIYFDEDASASWDDPSTFADGQLVAELSLDLRETLHRQAPGVGVAVGDGRVAQSAAEEFTIGDERFRFGVPGIEQRLRYVGAQMASGGAGSPLTISLTGSVTVTRRESTFVTLGDPNAPVTPAVSATEVDPCVELQPWLQQALDGLAQVETAGSAVSADVELGELDAAALREAAETISALAAAQREINVPGNAAAANRLVVTAMSTSARGLQAVATAAEAQDADLLAQGQIAMADGESLISRAEDAVQVLAADCESQAG